MANPVATALALIEDTSPVTDAERAEHKRLIREKRVQEAMEKLWPGGQWDLLERREDV